MSASLITQLYIGYYNRAPDPAGLSYWIDVAKTQSITQIAEFFSQQAESKAAYPYLSAPNVADPNAFVNQIYLNLFNRAATDADKAYWVGQLQSGKVSVGAFIATIQFSANSAGTGDDFNTLKNKATVGLDYATKLANSNTVFTQESAKDVISGVTKDAATVTAGTAKTDAFVAGGGGAAQTLVFTAGLDNLVGGAGNDTFNGDNSGTTALVQAGDQITGGAGTDTFRFFGADAVVPTLNGVEKVFLINASADSNYSAVAGLQQVWVEGVPTASRSVTVASTVIGGITKQTDNAKDVTFVFGNTATSVTSALDSNADAGTLNLNGNAITTLNLVTSGSASKIAGLASSGTETTVNVSGSADLTITNALAASVKTISAAGLTGGLTATLGNVGAAASVTTGSGKDVIDISANTAQQNTVVLGGGDDTLKIGAMTINSLSTHDGGEGVDTLQVTDGSKITSSTGKQFTGFETLATGVGTGTYDVTLIAGITKAVVDGDLAGNTTLSNLTTQGVSITTAQTGAQTLTLALKDATGTSDALTVAVGGGADVALANKLITNAIETVTINSTKTAANTAGTGNSLADLDVTGAKTLNFTGDHKLTVTATSNDGSVTKVDASALTKGLVMSAQIVGTQSVTFIGGDGADTFRGNGATGDVYKGGKGGDTLVLDAAGGADTVIYSAASDSQITATSAAGMDAIQTFTVAEDKIDLTSFSFSGFAQGVKAAGAITGATTTVSRTDFFDVAGQDRGVVYGTEGGVGYLFVDANKDGNFTAADDLIISLAGAPALTSTNILF